MDFTPALTVLVLLGVLLLLWMPVALGLLWLKGWRWGQPLALTFPEKLQGVLSLYLLIPPVLWGFAEHQPPRLPAYGLDLGLMGLTLFFQGLVLGLGSLGVLFWGERSLGWVDWPTLRLQPNSVLLALGVGIGVAGIEEVLFRGFMLQTLMPYGLPLAALFSSLIFALLHLVWEPVDQWRRASWSLPGLAVMGLVLVWATVLHNGEVNLAWGLHAGWVWTITVLDTSQAVVYSGRVPAWVTGLDGKPLAGIMGLLCLLGSGAALGFLYGR
jgi:hypothetical protein